MADPYSLYQIDDELRQLIAELIDNGGDINDEMDARLNAVLDAQAEKGAAYIAVIKSSLMAANNAKEEIARLTAFKKSHEVLADRLKRRLALSMQAGKQKQLDTRIGKLYLRVTNSVRTFLKKGVTPYDLPVEWRRMADPEADMIALKLALEKGDERATKVAYLEEHESATVIIK